MKKLFLLFALCGITNFVHAAPRAIIQNVSTKEDAPHVSRFKFRISQMISCAVREKWTLEEIVLNTVELGAQHNLSGAELHDAIVQHKEFISFLKQHRCEQRLPLWVKIGLVAGTVGAAALVAYHFQIHRFFE